MIYFTSDLHFNHENVIKYAGRPYSNVREMDKALIDNWNSVISEDDAIWILGDVFFHGKNFERSKRVLCALKGEKHLIIGNHDDHHYRFFTWHRMGFSSTHTLLPFHNIAGKNTVLIHNPLRIKLEKIPCELVLHGHLHQIGETIYMQDNILYVNVCVEKWQYKPVSIVEITALVRRYNNENM